MIFVINRRYPTLGAILSFISNLAFIAYGVATANQMMVILGVPFLALSVVQAVVRHRRAGTLEVRQ
jgi:hypothetical protein